MDAIAERESLYGFRFRDEDKRRKRENPDGSRRYDIKQLWQRSHEILNLALLGHKAPVIAKMLDIHPQTVCNTLNSTLGMEALSERRKERDEEFDELHDKVMELTRKSLAVYERILDAEQDPEVNLKMKKDTADTVALELSGLRAPTRIDSRTIGVTLTRDEIEEFKKRGIEAARANGKIVTVDPKPETDRDEGED